MNQSNPHPQPTQEPTRTFPPELELQYGALVAAGTSHEDPVTWPEGERVLRAYGPELIAAVLIKAFHVHLRKRSIAYLWVERMSDGGMEKLGTASRAAAKVKFLAEVDFILTFNHTAWKVLSTDQRVALVDHELTHCTIDGESLAPLLVPHDVEEFGAIVRKYGLWKPDLKRFGLVVDAVQQPSLFDALSLRSGRTTEEAREIAWADVEPPPGCVRTRAPEGGGRHAAPGALMRVVVYDCEIICAIPDKKVPNARDLQYCGGWGDYAGMGISVLAAVDVETQVPRVFFGIIAGVRGVVARRALGRPLERRV